MGVLGHLEVVIEDATNHQAFREGDDKVTRNRSSIRNLWQCIEVAHGQAFAIVIRAHKDFKWHGANGLSIELDFDQGALVNDYQILIARDKLRDTEVAVMIANEDGNIEHSIESLVLKNDESTYTRVGFAFQKLRDGELVSVCQCFKELTSLQTLKD